MGEADDAPVVPVEPEPVWLAAVVENIHHAARLLEEACRFIAEQEVRRIEPGPDPELRRLRQIEQAARAYIESPGRDDDYEQLALVLHHDCPAEIGKGWTGDDIAQEVRLWDDETAGKR